MVKMAKKMPETCDEISLDPQIPLLCIKDNIYIYIYIQNVWTYIHANSQDFRKSCDGSDKTKCVKKCG